MALDQRRLDELRLFTAVLIEPRLEADAVVLDVTVTETLRLLPIVVLRVTDENGVSAGPGLRGINLLGGGTQAGLSVRFGGETGVSATVDATTITPGTWMRHLGLQLLLTPKQTLRVRRACHVGRCTVRSQLEPRSEDWRDG